jgi:nitrogen fixation/metabolism regulation signal transduction histidine kinase
VLTSLSTGVLVLDSQQQLRSINPSAQLILGMNAIELNASAQAQLPQAVWQCVVGKQGKNQWQQQMECAFEGGETKTLLLRGAALNQDDGEGLLLVFDDVSDVMLAQKAQAWSEVARRLAHEIKNPLTPIQLSAERLAMKLGDKLNGADAELLKRGTGTIVTQVTALKNMVDEFRNYARLPQAQLEPLYLNGLLNEVLVMYKGAISVSLTATQDLIHADADQLRQVVHNLLGNAVDAAAAIEGQVPMVVFSTHDTPQGVCLRVTDNGAGFSAESLANLFEPYHTTKAHGTGLGLAIVHRIVQDHGAKIKVKNINDESTGLVCGAAIDVVFNILPAGHSAGV